MPALASTHPDGGSEAAPEPLADVARGARLKVCGIVEQGEIATLAAAPVDFVGLWHGVPGGPADLPLERWRELALAARATPALNPVLVTFLKDAEALAPALAGEATHWVQLHGYQTPGLVRKLKRRGVGVIKVLHVRGDECLESSLIAAYEKAGVDIFLLDVVTADGRIGSTGESLDPAVALSIAELVSRPFLLAGGLSAASRAAYARVADHPRFLGVDVDTNARGADGRIAAEPVTAIARAWKGAAGVA